MSNYHLRDKTLSLKGKGMLSMMFSLPDEWDYSVNGLTAICAESKHTVEGILGELKEKGYLTIEKKYPGETESGRFEYIYNIYEYPQRQCDEKIQDVVKQEPKNRVLEQEPKKQGLEIQGIENCPQLNTNISNTNKLNTKEKKSGKEKPSTFSPTSMLEESNLSDDVKAKMHEWLDYKKQIKNPYKSEIGFRKLLNKVSSMCEMYGANAVMDLIDVSMSNGWKGIIWDRLQIDRRPKQFSESHGHPEEWDRLAQDLDEEGNVYMNNQHVGGDIDYD